MNKYGLLAQVSVEIGTELPNELVEVHVPLKLNDNMNVSGNIQWTTIVVPKQSIKNDKVEFIIVDREFDDEHTSLLCPDMQTIIAVHDSNIKIPLLKNVWGKISGKKIKMDEV